MGCVKIEQGEINIDSPQYTFVSIPLFNFRIPNTITTFYTFPHPKFQIDYLYQTLYYCDSSENILKFFSTFQLGYPRLAQDQSNFKFNEYASVNAIFQLNVLDDFNNNGFLDEVFQVEYPDSSVIQVRDHYIALNPKSRKERLSDVLFNHSIHKNKVLTNFQKEDKHKIHFLFYWRPNENKKYLVFNKENRIVSKKNKDLDSLLILDVTNGKITSLCSMVPYGLIENYNGEVILGKRVLLISGAPLNGHNWDSLKDYNYYTAFLNYDEKSGIKLENIKKILDYKNFEILSATFKNDKNLFIIRGQIVNGYHQVYYLEKYDLKNLKKLSKVKINWRASQYLFYYRNKDLFKFYFENEAFILNTRDNSITKEKLPVNLNLSYDFGGISPSNNYMPKDLRFRIDVNNNGSMDLFITTKENQLICMDGRTNEILAASKKYNGTINWSVGRVQDGKVVVIVYYNDFAESFTLGKNSILTRINVYLPTLTILILLFLIPTLLYLLYRLYLTTLFLYVFTQKNNHIGFAILRKVYFGDKIALLKSNSIFRKNLNLTNKNKLEFNHLPSGIVAKVKNDFKHRQNGFYEITLSGNELKYLTFNTFFIKPFLSQAYCILTVYDETLVIKSQIIDLYESFVHQSTNKLGLIYNNFQNMIYEIGKTANLNELLLKQKESVQDGIKSLSQAMRSFLNTVKTTIYKEKLNFKSVLEDWISKNVPNIISSNNNITISVELDDIGEYALNIDTINNILHCSVYNSIQAKVPDRDLFITIRLKKYEDYFMLEIEDNGLGMSEAFLKSVTDWNNIVKTKGTGLGLKMIKKACDVHNAELSIESKLNIGTIVKIRFKYDK